MWVTNGPINNPATGEILADTGAIPAGTLSLTILVFTDVGFTMNLVQRNALNTANVNIQPIAVLGQYTVVGIPAVLVLNQRIRLEVDTAVTGNIQASILSA